MLSVQWRGIIINLLKKLFKKVNFKGNSDTEILLNLINNKGIDLALEKMMFSFFYIDFKKRNYSPE